MATMKIILFKRPIWLASIFLVGLNFFLFGFFLYEGGTTNLISKTFSKDTGLVYIEVDYLQSNRLSFKDFKELSNYFINIAEEKGAAYVLDLLKVAPLPPDTDLHLLAHVVGDILYKQEGTSGISICTPDFRNACSHTIVIGALLEGGEGAFPKIIEACRNAPGGSGAYTMCFHGLGHGVLAYSDYDLEKAIELCKKTSTSKYGGESAQCISGAIMEILSGVHNLELWEKQHKKYLRDDDPLYPCTAGFMPSNARYLCYIYITPHLFKVVGADSNRPKAEDYERAFRLCDKIRIADQSSRDACYGGFGKEFAGLAQERDIRILDRISDEELKTIHGWCLLADNSAGKVSCIKHATNYLYWGGENDRSMAIRFCGIIADFNLAGACFTNLIGAVSVYIQDVNYRKDFCKELPSFYYEQCQKRLTN